MVQDDAYGNKQRYERFKNGLDIFLLSPTQRFEKLGRKLRNDKYYCKNPDNLKYFEFLFRRFEAKDLSYIRRLRVIGTFKIVCHFAEKDVKTFDQDDIDSIVAEMHKIYRSVESKRSFIKNIKNIWRILFPETDDKGRKDSTKVPYAVRHLKRSDIAKSQERARDILTPNEVDNLFRYFQDKPQIQCFLALLYDGLLRPQEAIYLKLKDIEMLDSSIRVHVREHGKEGIGISWVDAIGYGYVQKWYLFHPHQETKPCSPFLFSESNYNSFGKFSLRKANERLKKACKDLDLDKRVNLYDLNRAGITHALLRGVPSIVIQKKRRWSSLKQLKVYDHSTSMNVMESELIRLGLKEPSNKNEEALAPKLKLCVFCNTKNGFSEEVCFQCKRPLDRKRIQEQVERTEAIMKDDVWKKIAELESLIKT